MAPSGKIILVTSVTTPSFLTTSEMNCCQFMAHQVAINSKFVFIRIRIRFQFHAHIYSSKYSKFLESIAAQTSILNLMDLQCVQLDSQSSLFQIGSIEAAMELKESRKSDSFEFTLSAFGALEGYVII